MRKKARWPLGAATTGVAVALSALTMTSEASATGRQTALKSADLRGLSSELLSTAAENAGVCGKTEAMPDFIDLAVDGATSLDGYKSPGHFVYDRARIPQNLQWSSWTAKVATASAYLWLDDGYPSIGTGTIYAIPAQIRLWRVRDGVFTRLSILPHGSSAFHPNRLWRTPQPRTYRATRCSNGGWGW